MADLQVNCDCQPIEGRHDLKCAVSAFLRNALNAEIEKMRK